MKKLLIILGLSIGFILISHVETARSAFVAEEVAKKVSKSVVTLESVKLGYASMRLGGAQVAPGVAIGGEQRMHQLVRNFASGFILDKEGHILSSESEVGGADVVEVTFADGSKGEADILVLDKGWGLALLKLKNPPKNLVPVKFGNSDKVKQGDSVVVVGSAGGYGTTVSYGIVSAIRAVRLPSGQLVQDMIQSDVVVNVGNQGSPLFNANGEVIGIHAVRAMSGGRGYLQNVTFYLPSNLLKRLYPQMIKDKKPAFRPWLGILPFTNVDNTFRMYMGLPDEYWDVGVAISDVWEGSPAYDAGLRKQDFILKVDGNLVKTIGELERIVFNSERNQILVFGVIRQGQYREFEIQIGNHPEETLADYI